MKSTLDAKCPYCGSNLVGKIGAFGAGASSTPKFPEAKTQVWKCDSCEKGFIYLGK